MNKYLAILVVILALACGFLGYQFVHKSQSIGAVPGGDFLNQVGFFAGDVHSTLLATTSQGSVTVTGKELTAWANAGEVSYSPGLVGATTITFPASSTVSSLVPKAGDRQSFCIRNATSTAGTQVTLAGSTGINLLVASSSVTALGGTKLNTGKVGCITFVRQASTATTYDIDALLTVYQ